MIILMLIGAHWPLSLDVVNRPFSGVLNITMCAAGNHLRAQKYWRWEVCCRSGRKPLGCIFMIAEYGIKILVGRIVVGTAILTGQPMNLSIYMFFGERGLSRLIARGLKKTNGPEWVHGRCGISDQFSVMGGMNVNFLKCLLNVSFVCSRIKTMLSWTLLSVQEQRPLLQSG